MDTRIISFIAAAVLLDVVIDLLIIRRFFGGWAGVKQLIRGQSND